MIGGDIGDDGHIAVGKAQAIAQDAAAGRLQHGVVDGGVAQHLAGRTRPAISPAAIWVPAMEIPSVVVMPTVLPAVVMMWAIMRVVVVLPLVPVTATIGTRTG